LVEDSVEACWRISKEVYRDPSTKLRVIGITGTNGKTTVAWVLRQALNALGLKTGYLGTLGAYVDGERFDTGLTTPFSPEINAFLARCVDAGIDVVTVEVSSHALSQYRVDGIEFDVAVFTNLSQDHLDFHADFTDYFDAKKRLFFDMPSKKSLKSVVNVDDEYGRALSSKVSSAITFGATGDVKLIGAEPGLNALNMQLTCNERAVSISAALGARFNVSNGMAVFSSLLALGYSIDDSARALSSVTGAPGRFESVPNGRGISVIVDYAHTPDALEKVLTSAKELTSGRLICVFGCGGDRDRAKRPKMAQAVSGIAHIAWVTSDNPRTENPNAIIEEILPAMGLGIETHVEPDRRKAIFGAIDEAEPGDCVVLAGKGHEDYQLIGTEKTHFDDREVAAEALS
jgi:UDP-N-acetylmuramoyl-L-alanyl-D-glutamate--2,6-diaminopimelate ligase